MRHLETARHEAYLQCVKKGEEAVLVSPHVDCGRDCGSAASPSAFPDGGDIGYFVTESCSSK